MNKKEPGFNIEISNQDSKQEIVNDDAALFSTSLVEVFQNGACHTLEAKRLSNSDNVKVEMNTIINDEIKSIRDTRNSLFR